MPTATVNRLWTIATWMLADSDERVDVIASAVADCSADAVALQSIGQRPVTEIAAALGMNHAWARSHHPRTRLLLGSAVGLAVLTPHRVASATDQVLGTSSTRWSSERRIAQTVVVERNDHSAYSIAHAVERVDEVASSSGAAPLVRIRPLQVGIDDQRAVEIPSGAITLATEVQTPVEGTAPMLTVTFEMPWVEGGFTAR